MSVTDTYQELTNPKMIEMFTTLFELKAQKKIIDDAIKAKEAEYKPMIEQANREALFYTLPTGQKFNIKRSFKKGSVNTDKMEKAGIDVDGYRNKRTTVFTLRVEKGEDDE